MGGVASWPRLSSSVFVCLCSTQASNFGKKMTSKETHLLFVNHVVLNYRFTCKYLDDDSHTFLLNK